MGLNTTSFNIDELITSYIDNQISDQELRSQIEGMLKSDSKLNAKYESELLTKNLLSSRLTEIDVPQTTYNRIISSIDNLVMKEKLNNQIVHTEYPSFWETLKDAVSKKFIGIPRYAFALVAIFVIGGLFVFSGSKKAKNPYILAGTEKSIMVQAVNSFHKILSGDVKPQLSTSNAAEIEKYVMDKSHFDAYVPQIEDYQLTGVVCNEYNGQELAHLIYTNGHDDILYIYQTPVTAVQKNNLDLPQDVQNEIVKAKFYMCDEVDDNNCTLTLWFKEDVVCASMTTMPKTEMYTTFARFNK